jgi:type I restriction enzyme S subunit
MRDWQQGPLIEFADLVSTGPFGSMLHKSDYAPAGVPLINPINIRDDLIVPDEGKRVNGEALARLSNYVLRAGDVIVGRRGEIGRCAVVGTLEEGWICGTGCFFVRPARSMDPYFLAELLRSPTYRAELERASTGATMKNLSNATLAQLRVVVPNRQEQQRIVGILDDAFEAIAVAKANAEKNLQNVRDLFVSHLQDTFTQRGNLVALSSLTTDIADGDHSPPPKAPTGIPFITISNVNKETRRIDFGDTFTVSREYFNSLKPHRRPKQGDVLYTVTGSFGIPILIEDDTEFCFQRHIGLIRPKADVDSRWLAYALLSPQVFDQADAGATGTAQRTVSLGVLRAIKIPSMPIDRQRTLVSRLDSLSAQVLRLKEINQAKLAALDELKKSLLHQAFSGRL